MLNYNIAYSHGGAIESFNYSSISFEGNSTTLLNNNTAKYGGALYSYYYGSTSFEGNSTTRLNYNTGNRYGGAIYSVRNGSTSFKGNSTTVFNNNTADRGGAIYSYLYCNISFEGNSPTLVLFNNNIADLGGAVYFVYHSKTSFKVNSTTLFNNNTADQGGAIFFYHNDTYISFEGNSTTLFNNNTADQGGAIFSYYHYESYISFKGNSSTVFRDNTAYNKGGALRLTNTKLTFDDYSTVNFTNNKATIDATIFSTGTSDEIMEIGSPTVIFNDYTVNWCKDTCLPANLTDQQIDEDFAITIDSSGTVSCIGEQNTFVSLNRKCNYKYLEDILVTLESNASFIISDMVIISSVILLSKLNNISIIANKDHSIMCVNNAGLQIEQCSNIKIQGINWAGCGTYATPVINILNSSDVTLQNCLFEQSKGPAVVMFELSREVTINDCRFINNIDYRGHGAAIHYSSNDNSQTTFVITNCNFSHNKGATSLVYINSQTKHADISLSNSFFHNNHGVFVYLSHQTLHINGEVLFENNVAENGSGIHINYFSKVIFDKNANVKFTNNSRSVYPSGVAIFLNDHSSVIFDDNSVVAFKGNKVNRGTIHSKASSNVTFKATCNVTFSSNSAEQSGAAIYLSDDSHVTFTGRSNIKFSNNVASANIFIRLGGAVYLEHFSSISFEEKSTVAFYNNSGYNGGALLSLYNSIIVFKDNSTVMFNNNKAYNSGGALFSNNGNVTIKGNSNVTFNNNEASKNGGAVHCEHYDSLVSGANPIGSNETTDGRAVYNFGSNSIVSVFEFAHVTFTNNTANQNGGAMYCGHHQIVWFGGNSMVTFSGNKAKDGGAVHAFSMYKIIFKENINSTFSKNHSGTLSRMYSGISFMGRSKAAFNNNAADNGGTFYLSNSTTLTFNDSAMITFTDNKARQNGGVFYSMNSFVLFNRNSNVSLAHNEAALNGGVMYCDSNSTVSFSEFTNVTFNDNKAINGGVLFANNNSKISFEGHASVTFFNNEARSNGGVGYYNGHCSVTFKQNANVIFKNNNALFGGAICLNSNTNITFEDNSTALLKYNTAMNDGGAINILRNSSIMVKGNTTIKFNYNHAQYGGTMFFDATHTTLVFSNNETNMSFIDNTARIAGSQMYFDSTVSSGNCLNNRIVDITNKTQHFIATPPNKIQFSDPATCVDYDNKTEECKTYYLKHIMLGEEINIPVCVLNYCNQPSYSTQFILHGGNNQNYSISGSNHILLSCNDTFQGISITGNNHLSNSSNYTIKFTLYDDRNSDWKQVSVNLTVELKPCYSGFWQYSGSKKCECYNASDIVFCSGSSSTIRRGYWFGKVTEKPTVTICPINYCNFTCCETSNGYYQLSPVRDNQCRSHRSGTACGSCTYGYTLSFDSTECVEVDSCTAGQKVLVILLTMTYWIVMVTIVFVMMHYKVPIGYLYSITYYYSIVDILLSENLHTSRGLYLTVSIMSSFSKITPQFLGELCLTTGMSGIDQYFIHYIHPSAVILILIIISLSARSSRRISVFISRGIIHVICLLLLLSYTSIASTSVLLIRPLTFHGIDKVYTYISPDIEFFHGRHLAYGIVALICIVTIVVGLPLLLTLEPFLNRKLNFAKIKPLLDQFQGCYKDKHRCFAGYYMVCRLVIITIVIVGTFNNIVANYLLIYRLWNNCINTIISKTIQQQSS